MVIENNYDLIVYEIPKKSEYFGCLRLTTSGIANTLNFTIDEINDIKLIVTEVCTFFINNIESVIENIRLEYKVYEDKLSVKITDKNAEKIDESNSINAEMFLLIMDSLTDNFEINYEDNCIEFEFKCI